MSGDAGSFRARLAAVPRRLLLGLVKAYRLLIGPALGPGCRFEPSCLPMPCRRWNSTAH